MPRPSKTSKAAKQRYAERLLKMKVAEVALPTECEAFEEAMAEEEILGVVVTHVNNGITIATLFDMVS